MRLYLDDDSTDAILVRLLQRGGHDNRIPADAGLAGEEDPVHLTHAIREDRVPLSGNHDDYRNLHNLIMQARGHHPGIFITAEEPQPFHVHTIVRMPNGGDYGMALLAKHREGFSLG